MDRCKEKSKGQKQQVLRYQREEKGTVHLFKAKRATQIHVVMVAVTVQKVC